MPAHATRSGRRHWLGRLTPPALCFGVYAVIAYVAYAPTSLLDSKRIFSCACGDAVQQAWYLAWTPYALLHGHNVFYTTQMNYPSGVDLGSNTLMPLLGLLATPFTLTIGPAGALVLMMRLGFALSAISMCLVLRRWTTWWPAAFIGGLLYGFSPYMLGQGHTHLHLLFVPLPPLLLALGDELLVRRRWNLRRIGLLIGIVAGLQYLVSAEVLASCGVIAVIGIAYLAVGHPAEVRDGAVRLLGALAWSAGPFLLLAGYPAYTDFTGPGHITGPTQPISILASYHGDLLAPFLPTVNQRFGPASWFALGNSFGAGNYQENGSYLGIPLFVALVALGAWARRVAIVRFAAFMAFAGFVLSLGPRLEIDGHATSIPLPYAVLLHLPLFAGGVPDRYSLFLQMFCAVLFAVGIDRLRERVVSKRRSHGKMSPSTAGAGMGRRWPEIAVVVTVAAVLLPLFPRFPIFTTPTDLPSYVADGGLASQADGSTVLTYPYTEDLWDTPMLWQAQAGFPSPLLGEYAIVTDSNGHVLPAPPLLPPATMQQLFASALGTSQPGTTQRAAATATPPALTPSLLKQLRVFLVRYDVGTILVRPVGFDPNLVLSDLTDAIGRRPSRVGQLYVWTHVSSELRRAPSAQ